MLLNSFVFVAMTSRAY